MVFDKEKYKVYTWKHWMMFSYILNPGIAINELILGQRVPKVTLIDKISNKPLAERTFVPCTHCETVHDARTWATENGTAFKNWFGLYCHNCGGVIPCLTNLFSFIILAVTYPILGGFRKSMHQKWLKKQPERYVSLKIESLKNPFARFGWIKLGLTWGAIMFLVMSIIFPLFYGIKINIQSLFFGLGLWSIGGLLFGFTMKLITTRTVKNFANSTLTS